jgi:glutamyl-tRNA synthetase
MHADIPVRVRFAPSPTGYLHVGGLRTALYNYLFARKHGGTFILRIEDTDRARFVEGAVENLIRTLEWAGLDYDEGPGKGGPAGPYVQSERLDIYRNHVEQLIASGNAYRCFCTPARLDEVRKNLERQRLNPKYDRHCLALSDTDIHEKIAAGIPHVVRMKVPDSTTVKFRDLIRQDVEFSSELIDDQVLMKSDGYPTYHLANVVDDHLMGITHVVRGEEWLSSTPKHVLLYRYFGWELPAFAHLPLLLNPDRTKLSKRQGDVAVEDYRSKGYLKEALVNFVAFLGWNPGTEQDIFSLDELVRDFSLERVGNAGAIFNLDKLNWLNFQHLRNTPDSVVLSMLRTELKNSRFSGITCSDDYLARVITAMRERVTFVKDVLEKSPYFFESPGSYDPEVVKKRWTSETAAHLQALAEAFRGVMTGTAAEFEAALHQAASTLGVGNGVLIHAVRLAVSGVGGGPGVYEILEIIGREEAIQRIGLAIQRIPSTTEQP